MSFKISSFLSIIKVAEIYKDHGSLYYKANIRKVFYILIGFLLSARYRLTNRPTGMYRVYKHTFSYVKRHQPIADEAITVPDA